MTALALLLLCPADPPNVLVILTDDQGWADVGYNNPAVYTPNIDRLAASGATLTRHYVMPQCTPTRVALFTGRYPNRFGTTGLQAANDPSVPKGTLTMASFLKSKGYETALTGKWHMGSYAEFGPNHYGFDESYGALAGAVGAYTHLYRSAQQNSPLAVTWHRNGKHIEGSENGRHVTDLVTDAAVEFIRRDRDRPWFLYLPYFAPHTPLDERGRFAKQPTQLDGDRPGRWLNEDRIEWFNDPAGKVQAEKDPERRLFLAVLHHLDDAIGRVLTTLDETGQRQNTVILFSSDNGPQVDWGGSSYPEDRRLTDFNQEIPFRGSKSDVYEGGVRVPGAVSWPARIEPKTLDTVQHVVDWLPTVSGLLGAEIDVPDGQPPLDGEDFSARLLGDAPRTPDRELYVLHGTRTNKWSLRRGDWKIVAYQDVEPTESDWQLFDLSKDPNETTDLAVEERGKVSELHRRFLEHRSNDVDRPVVPGFESGSRSSFGGGG